MVGILQHTAFIQNVSGFDLSRFVLLNAESKMLNELDNFFVR